MKEFFYDLYDKVLMILMTYVAIISFLIGIIGGIITILLTYNVGAILGGIMLGVTIILFVEYYQAHGKQPDMIIYATDDQFDNENEFVGAVNESIKEAMDKAKKEQEE